MPADRVAKIIAMASAQIRERFDFDASHVIGMFHARFPPCGDFDRVNELSAQVEQRQVRLASNRVALGQLCEDSRPVHHCYTRDLAMP
jgi:hypothetical protein